MRSPTNYYLFKYAGIEFMRVVSILGSTGSIGQSTLDVIRLNKDDFYVFALSCDNNVELILKQAIEFKPKYIVCPNNNNAKYIAEQLPLNSGIEVLSNNESLNYIASHDDVTHVVAAISGSAGLESTFSAVKSGKEILLANKESLVMSGQLIMGYANKNKCRIIPIDSEHNAIYQVLNSTNERYLKKIILTASGGPFLNTAKEVMSKITVEQALKHPNWSMGKKVTIDSATMMNKGLEVIEAFHLFNLSHEQIEVVVHPQSIIHSLVEFIDGSLLTQIGLPDMRIPISYALGYPERIRSGLNGIDLTKSELSFLKPDPEKFPCLELSFEAIKSGHEYCVSLNAANEVAVDLFLKKKIHFKDIFTINYKMLKNTYPINLDSISKIIQFNDEIKKKTIEFSSKFFS